MDGFLKKAAVARNDTVTLMWHDACNEHLTRRYTMFKKILATLMLLGVLGATAGCNTMHGFGQDVERGGEKIQDKAR